jgi:hypothetical protein
MVNWFVPPQRFVPRKTSSIIVAHRVRAIRLHRSETVMFVFENTIADFVRNGRKNCMFYENPGLSSHLQGITSAILQLQFFKLLVP